MFSDTFSEYIPKQWTQIYDDSQTFAINKLISFIYDLNNLDADHLQLFHYIAIIVGIVLFVLSFFDFAGILYDIKLLFVAAVIGIFSTGVMMLYATYVAFNMSCKSAFNSVFDTASLSGAKNVIQANDEVGISIMVLDLIAALLLISAAISFSRTY